MIICPSSCSSLLGSFVYNLGPLTSSSAFMTSYSVALKVFLTILPISQSHPNLRTIQVSSLDAKQSNKSEYMSCADKSPECNLLSTAQESSASSPASSGGFAHSFYREQRDTKTMSYHGLLKFLQTLSVSQQRFKALASVLEVPLSLP